MTSFACGHLRSRRPPGKCGNGLGSLGWRRVLGALGAQEPAEGSPGSEPRESTHQDIKGKSFDVVSPGSSLPSPPKVSCLACLCPTAAHTWPSVGWPLPKLPQRLRGEGAGERDPANSPLAFLHETPTTVAGPRPGHDFCL